VILAGHLAPGFTSQRQRPAIIRCTTMNNSPSSSKMKRLPIRLHADDGLAIDGVGGRVEGAKNKGADNIETGEALADHTRAEGMKIEFYVGQFGHISPLRAVQTAIGQARLRPLVDPRMPG